MATIDNILTLIEKGYSKDEIDALLAQDETTDPELEEAPEESQEDANESQESANESQGTPQVKDPPEDITHLTAVVSDLAKQVQTLTAATQLQNIKRAEQPEGEKEMSAEDYLLRTIHPEYRKEDV